MSTYDYAITDEEFIEYGWTKDDLKKLRTAQKAIHAKRKVESEERIRIASEEAQRQREQITARYNRLGVAGRKAYTEASKQRTPSGLGHYEAELSYLEAAERADAQGFFDSIGGEGPWWKFWKA